jgi:aconitate hydratase
MISQNGVLANLITSGARLLESACGPCIGMGFAPPSGGVSVRTFNRNFEGRSGTKDAKVYLASPEVAAACAITGVITDPRDLGVPFKSVDIPEKYVLDDRMFIFPENDGSKVEIVRGPNIKPLPTRDRIANKVSGKVLLKVGDNITTDHIMPAGAKVLPLRSNVPAISQYVFEAIDPTFPKRAKEEGGGFIVGGTNYGQGSSREHAALAPMYLGVKGVITKAFARIHLANLINFGILPLTFVNEADYDKIDANDTLELDTTHLEKKPLTLRNVTKGIDIPVTHALTDRDLEIVKAGGTLAYVKSRSKK